MAEFGSSIHVDAPPARVWDLVTDLAGAAGRIGAIKSVEVLTDQPFGVGTRWRETRVMFGKEATEEMTVTSLTPGESYTTEAESCGCHYTCVVRVAPEGDGSVLAMSMHARGVTLLGRVMGAVMTPLMKGMACKAFAKDLQDLKAAAERG
jgi:carbon monoxide dehydrogenase subunit G